jgi:peptidoglycan hydrolase-like protein with peptidoglycan-binding domain
MKKLLLATVATLALSLPAMAQSQSDTSQTPQSQSGSQLQQPESQLQQSQDQSASGAQQQAQNTIEPSQLNTQEIRQIQMSLNKQGFSAGHVDGKWGPDTEKAVKDFQQQKQMQATGQLDQQTLQALGVNMTAQQGGQQNAPQQPRASTTGQAPSESQPNTDQQNAPNVQPEQGQPQQNQQQ